jgi:DNA polymerase
MTELNHEFLDTLEEYGPIARTLSQCLRPTFTARHDDTTLVWGDWSAIEARMLPWLADNRGSNAVLDVFRTVDADPNAADIYMIEAGNIHGLDPNEVNARIQEGDKVAKGWRQEGKVAVLSLGFGGGVGALLAMATGYGLHFSEEQAQRIVDVWRENNPWAKRFWDELKTAFFNAYENPGVAYKAGRVHYIYDPDYHGGTIFCVQPCGRLLSYPNLKYREVERTDRKTGDTYTQKVMTYRKGYKWGTIWHGILAENPTQGVSASILRAKLRHLDAEAEKDLRDGFEPLLPVVGHTHDEIIGEPHEDDVEEASAYLKDVMEKPLEWSDGLPLVAEITNNTWYTKALD